MIDGVDEIGVFGSVDEVDEEIIATEFAKTKRGFYAHVTPHFNINPEPPGLTARWF